MGKLLIRHATQQPFLALAILLIPCDVVTSLKQIWSRGETNPNETFMKPDIGMGAKLSVLLNNSNAFDQPSKI